MHLQNIDLIKLRNPSNCFTLTAKETMACSSPTLYRWLQCDVWQDGFLTKAHLKGTIIMKDQSSTVSSSSLLISFESRSTPLQASGRVFPSHRSACFNARTQDINRYDQTVAPMKETSKINREHANAFTWSHWLQITVVKFDINITEVARAC